MFRRLSVLVKKEIKDLLKDPKIIIVIVVLPSIMYILLGQLMSFAITQVREEAYRIAVFVLNDDEGIWSTQLIGYLSTLNLSNLKVINGLTINEAILQASEEGFDILLYIPESFSQNLTSGVQSKIELIGLVKELGMGLMSKTFTLIGIIESFSKSVTSHYIISNIPGSDPASIINPIVTETNMLIKGEIYPESIAIYLSNSIPLIIMGPLLVLGIVTSIAASSMGVEKEEKTLEVLFSFPLRRSDIVIAKGAATCVVSFLAAVSLSIGLISYLGALLSATSEGSEITTTLITFYRLFGAENMMKIGLSQLIMLLLGSFIGLIMSSIASNVREAQAFASSVWLPVMGIFTLLVFMDVSMFSNTGRILLSLLPFSAPIIVIKTALSDLAFLGYISIAFNTLYLAIVIYVAVKWFDSEKILTARPSFKIRIKR